MTPDIGDYARRALGGWAAINEATKYGNRGAVPNLDRAMKTISFGGFVLPAAGNIEPAFIYRDY